MNTTNSTPQGSFRPPGIKILNEKDFNKKYIEMYHKTPTYSVYRTYLDKAWEQVEKEFVKD